MFFLLLGSFLYCTSVDKKTYFNGFYKTSQYQPHQQLSYAKKYGYHSECLVLMEGPVPSRMEPCAIGDLRSGKDLYRETEVEVAGDSFPVDWYIAGYGYGLHVNQEYYQSIAFFTSYSQNRGLPRFSPLYYKRDIYGTEVMQYYSRYPYRVYPFYPGRR
ncbi:hypothetical protein ND861_17440 [Leptospira sp. 2 VSF19]|uniref:Lipoprotein n=1 Tax=Leptospira soteropolitanensis TaxID=2950025 RepID=A0AAW5VQW9_9LEPT|nr:hypothetical protein [Leptospira soteropolitanensis]MCW7494434.1 hypothetical protein [Leptospira soteropolitanensis]MCW7502028.1 hypothetical protein [Leptospira soteropolitanensis]MCW7524280.1 hypothetical protein [Leptospira soteropolitanensis]MCW7528145.1 hypothetical protein [Leptospira soteropolitanensis]MCW7531998.1 hypothetical protein [Leptospira soteropolitanensis]